MSASSQRRTVSILGSTGSIGTQTLDVLRKHPDEFSIRWITCNTRVEDLAQQAREFNPFGVAIREEDACKRFALLAPGFKGRVLCGEQGLCEAAADDANDVVMSAMVGFSGVIPTMAAIEAGHVVGLANKETLVSAGALFIEAVAHHNAKLIAVDSEHSAILQCLIGERISDVERIIITASGGPFRSTSLNDLASVSASTALQHPNWTMGNKITIDSSTLMNKGFEVIEAHWLFNIPREKIEVVIHPQSIVHSMVEFVDGSVKAQMGLPSMLVPLQYALTFPTRLPLNGQRLDLATLGTLTFERPDENRFPCLRLAYEALDAGGTAGCVINAANEVAVSAFLNGRIGFTDIPRIISSSLEHMEHLSHPSLADVVALDGETRLYASSFRL